MRKFYKVPPTNTELSLHLLTKSFSVSLLKCADVLLISLLFFIMSENISAQTKLFGYVNPFIGTDAHGHTFPGATLPNGMVQLSPDTGIEDWDWCSGYHYSDSSIIGFSHTHLSGTGCADYGDILLMPTTGELKTDAGTKDNPDLGYRSRFSHKNEIAKAGYYSVLLDDYKIKAELTATLRAGFHKYTFPQSENSRIIIDLVHGIQDMAKDAGIKIIDNKTIEGYRRSSGWAKNHCVYFYAEFSKPFTSFGLIENGIVSKEKNSVNGKSVKGFVEFKTTASEVVLVKVGISHTSIEGARANVQSEIPGWDFDEVVSQADEAWQKELSSIKIESTDEQKLTVYYTALYHALLNPSILSDVDGAYIGMDEKIHKIENGCMYTVYSLWDTFRSENPLYTVIDSKKANDMVQSLVKKYEEHGLLPVWELASNETGTMIGYHSIPVITDAYFKGIRNYDLETAFEAMKKSAMQNHLGLEFYKSMGYIPSDLESESVSKTLEYAYDDWCIAMIAKDLGKENDYKYFIDRAKFYTNVFDPATSLMRAKKNGKWFEPFDPYSVSGNYTEANAWQYSFFVPQDLNGLMKLMGGDDKFISKLDELFTTDPKLTGRFQSDITGLIGQYAHGNEPSHHMAYLYNYAGAPSKTQEKIHEIVSTLYTDKPDGLCGNEDCGQMSAWYVFSAMGFYPVCPGDNKYIIGTPDFERVTINTGGEKKFTVIAKNLSNENFYIQSAKLNGKEYPFSYIKHEDILDGGELVFEMGSKPGNWGIEQTARPTSEIDYPFVSVPYLTAGERVFRKSISIALSSIDEESEIYFTIDDSDPQLESNLYSKPIVIDNTTELKAVCFKDGMFSKVITSVFNKIPEGRTIKLNTEYHHNYTGGGADGLIDAIKGADNFHTDAWQGYEGVNLDALIDLGSEQKLTSISASFLQNTGSWIFYPKKIEIFISDDGINFAKIYEAENVPDENNSESGIKEFGKSLEQIESRFIKVIAANVGACPPWHIASGGKAWLFIDEISIK
ncbi:MAG: GH92 family glycosyl hydrolase [bacterium]